MRPVQGWAWNMPANFERGAPGAHVRRLEPRAVVPQFAHLSRDRDGRCIVFLDTPSTVDDRRYVRRGKGYSLDCAGACGQQVARGRARSSSGRTGHCPRCSAHSAL